MNKENGTYNKHLQKYSRIVQDGNDDLVLQFTTEVLGLESLHWGYWDDNDQLNLENLKKAQKNFTSHLSSFIPEGVSQILDVGCGIGDNALHLSENGYKLTCISPDINHQKAFKKLKNGKINFHLSGIEKFFSEKQFDLALMSESSNYFDKDIGFEKLASLIKDQGFILSASLFRKKNTEVYSNFHIESEWLESAKKNGFEIINEDDITEKVLPSSEIGRDILHQHAVPSLEVMIKYLTKSKGLKSWLFSYFVESNFQKLKGYLTDGYVSHMLDPNLFKENARYVIYLMKKK